MELTLEELGAIGGLVIIILSPIYYQLYRISQKLDKVSDLSNRALTIVELCPHCPHRESQE